MESKKVIRPCVARISSQGRKYVHTMFRGRQLATILLVEVLDGDHVLNSVTIHFRTDDTITLQGLMEVPAVRRKRKR